MGSPSTTNDGLSPVAELDAQPEQNTPDIVSETEDSPAHPTVSRFFSRLFRIRRGQRSRRDLYAGGEEQSFDPEELLWKDHIFETETFNDEESSKEDKIDRSIYLVEEDNDMDKLEDKEKKLKHNDDSNQSPGRRAPRRATVPGAVSISPGGVPPPPNLTRYDSGALSSLAESAHDDDDDAILLQASVVTPRRKPLVVKAHIMEEHPEDPDFVMVHKRKLRIILIILGVLVLGLTVGLVAALYDRGPPSRKSSSSSASFDRSRSPNPAPRPPRPPSNSNGNNTPCHVRGGGCDDDKDQGQA